MKRRKKYPLRRQEEQQQQSMAVTAVALVAVTAVALEVTSAVAQKNAADKAASVTRSIAQWNADADASQARQVDINTTQNIDNERTENKAYLSKQRQAYAAAGVQSSGSALDVQATTAGRLEQRVQQEYNNSLTKQENLYADAGIGKAEGNAQADAYTTEGDIDILNGAAAVAGTLSSYAGAHMQTSSVDSPGTANQLF